MFSHLSPEALVSKDHTLRLIRPLANAALERLSTSFYRMYSAIGRPSIPPEQLLRAAAVAGVFQRALGTATDRAKDVYHDVPMDREAKIRSSYGRRRSRS